MIIGRRGFLGGILAACAAPAIVRIASIMPVKTLPEELALAGDFCTENLIVNATERYSIIYIDPRFAKSMYTAIFPQWTFRPLTSAPQ